MKSLKVIIRNLPVVIILLVIVGSFTQPGKSQAQAPDTSAPFGPLTPDTLTFTGRRGASYTVTWDPSTYVFNFSTPNSSFPWDWISFVGNHGAVALSGMNDVNLTLEGRPTSIAGVRAGDIFRIKGNGTLAMAHLTKIGLVIGTGAGAQRAWFSNGTITQYTVAPDYVGYQVNVLGRVATVRISDFNPQSYVSVAVIEVSLNDPTDAYVVFATDLEPRGDSYTVALESINSNGTYVAYDAANAAVRGGFGSGMSSSVYLYSDQPLHSWSASNQTLNTYLSADTLDNTTITGASDARSALKITAQPVQYFYVGSQVLSADIRSNPIATWNALRDARLAELNKMPRIDTLDPNLSKFKFASQFSNLILAYLINPNGGVFYSDKAFLYASDALMPLIITPHILPSEMISAYQQSLSTIAAQQYGTIGTCAVGSTVFCYSNKRSNSGAIVVPLPTWYTGNTPDIILFNSNGSRRHAEVFSDLYGTSEFVSGVYRLYSYTGDVSDVLPFQNNITAAISGLRAFDAAYDTAYGEDGNEYPNLLIPMGDVAEIPGEYPAESAQAIYAYEDANALLQLYGLNDPQLLSDAAQMRSQFDSYFWHIIPIGETSLPWYAQIADARHGTKTPGSLYNDTWSHTLLTLLRGDMGYNHLADMLITMTDSSFYETSGGVFGDVHWLGKGSESFATIGRWNLPTYNTNGWGMEGGYSPLPSMLAPLAYYKVGDIANAETYTSHYLNKWLQYGPYEMMVEYDHNMPGLFYSSSMYAEAAVGTTWLLQEMLGLQVEDTQVTIAPVLDDQFVLNNLQVTSMGHTAVLDYSRTADGCENINVTSNTGLTILAPNVTSVYTGPANGDWSNPAHWSNGVPGVTQCVEIHTGSSVQLSANAQARQVNIEADATLNLGSYDLTAETALINNGTLLQTKLVNSACTAAAPCQLLHITDQSGTQDRYGGIDIYPTSSDLNMSWTTVSVRGNQSCGGSGNLGSTILRCIDITPTNVRTATVKFYYRDAELNGNIEAQLNIYHFLGGGTWEPETTTGRGGSGDMNYVTAAGIDHYSPFTLNDELPTAITLRSFQAEGALARPWLLWGGVALLAIVGATIISGIASRRRVL